MEINHNQATSPPVGSKQPSGLIALKKAEINSSNQTHVPVAEGAEEAGQTRLDLQAKKNEREEKRKDDNVIDMNSVVAQVNEQVQNVQRDLLFSVDELSGKDVVTILDSKSKEVIKQIPSEEMLELARRLNEQLEGDDVAQVVKLFSSIA